MRRVPAVLVVSVVIVTAGAFAGMRAAGQAPAVPGPSVRYIVPQRITNEAVDVKAEVARLQTTQQDIATQLRGKQQALETTRTQLAAASDAAERARLQKAETEQRSDLDRSTAQAQQDIQALQRQLQASLQARIRTALDEILRGQNVQMVLNADTAVVWAAPGADVTSAVIERLNTGRVPATAPVAPR